MPKALRYRWSQAVVLALLSTLVIGSAAFAPMYDRALQQAMVRSQVGHAPINVSGIRLGSSSVSDPTIDINPAATAARSVDELRGLLPPSVDALTLPGYGSTAVAITTSVAPRASSELLWRDGMCTHVRWRAGRCPDTARAVAVSQPDAAARGWQVGSRILVKGVMALGAIEETPMTVTGIYDFVDDPYWFGRRLDGRSGLVDQEGTKLLDIVLTDRATFDAPWSQISNTLDVPVDPSTIGIDELLAAGAALEQFQSEQLEAAQEQLATGTSGPRPVTVTTGLLDLAHEAQRGREQANEVVPLIMAQLGLLALLVLWLVVGAAVDQRRPEIALAKLRGWGNSGAARMLMRELGAAVLLGVPLGFAAAVGLCALARRLVLVGDVPFELLPDTGVAVLLGMAAVLPALLPIRQAARQPVAQLLRRVPQRRSAWKLQTGEVILLTCAAFGFLTFATGALSGPIALVAPSFLALGAGLILARVFTAAVGAWSRRAWARGRVGTALWMVQVSRQPAARTVMAVAAVATALTVFAANSVAVAARNREFRAAAEVGAATVLTTSTRDLSVVQSATHQADSTGSLATAVGRYRPSNDGSTETMAVTPAEFARIAQFPGVTSTAPWGQLGASPPPILLKGTDLSVQLSSTAFVRLPVPPPVAVGPGPDDPTQVEPPDPLLSLKLSALVVPANGVRRYVSLGELPPAGAAAHVVTAKVPCKPDCLVLGFSVRRDPAEPPISAAFTLIDVAVDGVSADLGPAANWRFASPDAPDVPAATAASPGLRLNVSNDGDRLEFRHASSPAVLAALVTPQALADYGKPEFGGSGLDGVTRPMASLGTIPLVPGSRPEAIVVDARLLARDSDIPTPMTSTEVWLGDGSPDLEQRVTAALSAAGVSVVQRATIADAQRALDESAAAWAIQLAVVAGVVALLFALLVLSVVTATTWRQRSRDSAALRMAGVSRRSLSVAALGEQLPGLTIAVMAGAVCGVIGSRLSMPSIPLFATPPTLNTLDLATAWGPVIVAAGGALVLMWVCGVLAARWLSARVRLERLRGVS